MKAFLSGRCRQSLLGGRLHPIDGATAGAALLMNAARPGHLESKPLNLENGGSLKSFYLNKKAYVLEDFHKRKIYIFFLFDKFIEKCEVKIN